MKLQPSAQNHQRTQMLYSAFFVGLDPFLSVKFIVYTLVLLCQKYMEPHGELVNKMIKIYEKFS